MSSDNGVYILVTKDQFKIMPGMHGDMYLNMFDLPITAYRVVHAQGVDEFDYLKNEKLYMLGKFMHDVWGKAQVFYDPIEARDEAHRIHDGLLFSEYGICIINAEEFSFT
jgi:hypothetical protein